MKKESVLTISASDFFSAYNFQGFSKEIEPFQDLISSQSNLKFLERSFAEINPTYKQIITYGILRCANTFLSYKRTPLLSEKRLHNLYSIGIGGHIGPGDIEEPAEFLQSALFRELHEELIISSPILNIELAGIINDDSNDVGKVHIGAVYWVEVENTNISAKDNSITDCKFCTIDSLVSKYDRYENWSKICIDYLKKLR
jgi:predicted NUDIX family phosphoesterase